MRGKRKYGNTQKHLKSLRRGWQRREEAVRMHVALPHASSRLLLSYARVSYE
jgi:hypothetical protein